MKAEAAAWGLGAIGAVEGFYKYGIKPELTASRGWLAVGALISAYEFAAPQGQLLSEGVDRALEKHPILTIGAIAITSAHLANLIPDRVDPFYRGLKLIKR